MHIHMYIRTYTHSYMHECIHSFTHSYIYIHVHTLIRTTMGPIELFVVPFSAPRLVDQRPWYVLSCLWDGLYKRPLAAKWKE